MVTIYVQLLDEAVDVWRPVEAEPVGETFRMISEPPADEQWEFRRGDVVRCEPRILTRGGPSESAPTLVAVEKVGAGD